MRASLPNLELKLLTQWEAVDLYGRLRRQSQGRQKYVLHDGPPYANGDIHIGTALNKILKDIVVRSRQMTGFDSNYVPGWDCHGLPIEWKIEEKYRAAGRDKNQVPILKFREECRAFADYWVNKQREQFRRLGVIGNWTNPYTTMTHAAEAQICREIHKFLLNGSLYRGLKPVLWSVVEKTALAEAEVEYNEHVSDAIWVRFPIVKSPILDLANAAIVIWTTTPWTIPANCAIAYGETLEYGIWKVIEVQPGTQAIPGDRLVVATALAEAFTKNTGITSWTCERVLPGTAFAGLVCHHPLYRYGYDHPVPAFPADFITTNAGTGIVHIAPSHGLEDFDLCSRHGLEIPDVISEDGHYIDQIPLFGGLAVYTLEGREGPANKAVIEALQQARSLLGTSTLTHPYPHSWRSKGPLIFRATKQWFISMEATGLRHAALAALKVTKFIPPAGYNRLSSMITSRPDWCISRQRTWGVPIAIFVHKQTDELLKDPAVLARIASAFAEDGSDAWYTRHATWFLGDAWRAEEWQKVTDIVDVWFESGCTHAFALEGRPELQWPASLYLEGSDQHRGWFHSSLLESCGTRGRAPYDSILTHGFVLDEQGYKMSKSLGNSITPQTIIEQDGADILRLWAIGSDYSNDMRIGKGTLKVQVDIYRRLRNTFRYLLGTLDGFTEAEQVELSAMPELERWVLHRLAEIDQLVRAAIADYAFHTMNSVLYTFCTTDLSSFWFDIRKDSLYCDPLDSLKRRAVRTVLDQVFWCLTAWFAPILCFTAEEAWQARQNSEGGLTNSVHERQFPTLPSTWFDSELAIRWQTVRQIRKVVTGAIEVERTAKYLRSSLQAWPVVYCSESQAALLRKINFAEVCIVSGVQIEVTSPPAEAFTLPDVVGVGVIIKKAEGRRCERCWQVLSEVGQYHPDLCQRCADAVEGH
jgi:isoleucyl-tRNA synthetase